MTLFLLILAFVGLSAALAWFFISHDRGAKEPVTMLWLAVGLGLAGAFAASLIEGLFLKAQNLQPLAAPHAILFTALAVGVIEEACKFVPLAVLLWRKSYFNEYTDGVIYFALVGLGFGLPKTFCTQRSLVRKRFGKGVFDAIFPRRHHRFGRLFSDSP